jgi:hypothetical protein
VGGTAAGVDCDGNPNNGNQNSGTLAAGASVVCTYSANLAGAVDGTNTATITSGNANVDGATAEAYYDFGDPVLSASSEPESITVSDTNGQDWSTSVATFWEYTKNFACPTDQNAYTNGVYTADPWINTAEINETGDDDIATVNLKCYAPVVTKNVTPAWERSFDWDITKNVDNTTFSGNPGDGWTFNYDIDIDLTYDELNFSASGTISVQNPDPDNSMTAGLTDAVNGFDGVITADGDCNFDGTNLTIPAGSTATCDYSVDMGDDLDGGQATEYTNTAKATIGGGSFTGTANFKFSDVDPTLADGSEPAEVTATDDNATPGETGDDHHSTTISETTADVITYAQSGICPTDRTKYTNGVYTVILTNIADIDQTDDTDTKTVTVNCEASFVDILKTTNGSVDPSKDIRFKLYDSTGADLNDEVSTLNDADGRLGFATALVPGDSYTICESPVPAGYTFEISVNGGNVLTYAGPPGALNPTGEVQCFDFTAAASPTTLLFEVNNSFPGGAPRTPGYWKNWNTCTGGNQAKTAAKLGGVAEGVFLLDDLLPQTVGDLEVTKCKVGVRILDSRDIKGKKRGNDGAYILARSYLAALLNQDAGACDPDGLTFDVDGVGDDLTFQEVLNAAQALLDAQDFDGTGGYLGPKDRSGDREIALALYEIIDDYNNSELCTGEPSH